MVFATNFFMNLVKSQPPPVSIDPGVQKIFSLSNVSYISGGSDYFQLDTSSINPVPRSVSMIDDGTSIFQIEQSGYIERLSMSNAYDISTASYTGDNVTLTPVSAFHDSWCDENGQNWYFVEANTDGPIHYYTTSTGFDLSGLTKDTTTFYVNTRLYGVHSGGNKIFVSGQPDTQIYQIDISNGWTNASSQGSVNIANHSNLVGSVNVVNNTGISIGGLAFNGDGTKLMTLFVKNSGAVCNLVEFTLSSAYDVLGSSTVTVENEFDVAATIPASDRNSSTQGFQSMVIDRDTESHIYLPDVLSDRIFHLKMNPSQTVPESSGVVWDLSNVTYVSNTYIGAVSTSTNGISVSDDFSTLMLSEFNAFNETTGTTVSGDFDGTETTAQTVSWLNSSLGSITDLYSNNGTDLMFTTVGSTGLDRLYRASMSTAWDMTSFTSSGYMQLKASADGGVYGDPQGVWFNDTYVYVSQGGFIANFTISSLPWNSLDIQSYVNTSVDVSGTFANDDYQAINVDPTGTKLFCVDRYNRQLVQYSLGTAHNLSTLNTGTRITVSLDSLIPNVDTTNRTQFRSISIVPRTTGTKLYLGDYHENEIYSLNLNPL